MPLAGGGAGNNARCPAEPPEKPFEVRLGAPREMVTGGAAKGSAPWAILESVSIGEELLEERRRRRRAGDPRLTEEGRAFLERLTDGDLAQQFQEALNSLSAADPLLGDHEA